MARKFLTPIDMTQNEIQNLRLQQLGVDPGSPVTGQVWYHTSRVRPAWYGTQVNDIYPFSATNVINTGVLRDGSGNFAANVATFSSVTLSGSVTNDTDATTKIYVDALVQGLDLKNSCRCATTTALPAYTYSATNGGTLTANANGAFPTIDTTVTLTAGQSILVKDETAGNAPYNGIYTVSVVGTGSTPWVLVRRGDANTSAEVTSGMYTYISEGTVNGGNGWALMTLDPITLNTTALSFSQFSGAGQIVAGTGLSKSGNTLSISATYAGQNTITTLGTVTTGTWNATAIGTQYGGTGLNTSTASNGQLLIGNGTGLTLATLTQGSGITITNGAGSITIAATGGGGNLSGTLVSGRIPFASGTSTLTDSSQMTFSTASGFNVNRSGASGCLMLGLNAGNTTMTGQNNTIVGVGIAPNITSATMNVFMGSGGLSGYATGQRNVGIGHSLGANDGVSDSVFIGWQAGAGASNVIALGSGVSVGVPDTCQIGKGVSTFYFGSGPGTNPTSVTFKVGAPSNEDISGGNFTIEGGVSTDANPGGYILFRTARGIGTPGAGVPNSLVDRLAVLQDGAVSWTGITTANAPAVSAANSGNIFYDSTLQKFRYSANGSAYSDLIGASVSLTSTYIGFGSVGNALTGSADFTWNDSTKVLAVNGAINQTSATGFTTRQAATQDAIAIVGRAGGTSTYAITITPGTLTGNATWTIPQTGNNTFAGLLAQTFTGLQTFTGGITVTTADVTITDRNIILSATTGTKIGTATTQKLGFYNATPIAQPAAGDVITSLTNLGLIASGGTYAAGSINGTVAIANGGTGASSTSQNFVFAGPTSGAGAPSWRALVFGDLPSAVTRKYTTDIGNGVLQSFTITHGLNSKDVTIEVYDNNTLLKVECDVTHTDAATLTLNFTVVPTSNQFRVVVIG